MLQYQIKPPRSASLLSTDANKVGWTGSAFIWNFWRSASNYPNRLSTAANKVIPESFEHLSYQPFHIMPSSQSVNENLLFYE
jgi:hypothetical protein